MICSQSKWCMPCADTFTMLPVNRFVARYWKGCKVSIDPFARNSPLATYTNDLNPATKAKSHMLAADFLQKLLDDGVKADLIFFDPPYSATQVKSCYEEFGLKEFTAADAQNGSWKREKSLCVDLLKIGGIFLQFGWQSTALPKKRGFETVEIMLVPHGGAHNDTICVAQRKVPATLFDLAAQRDAATMEDAP